MYLQMDKSDIHRKDFLSSNKKKLTKQASFFTDREIKIICNFISVCILVFVIGLILGMNIKKTKPKIEMKPEIYYQEKSAELYNMAIDYLETKEAVRKNRLFCELESKVNKYNQETNNIEVWTFNCPQKFSLSYLIGDLDI